MFKPGGTRTRARRCCSTASCAARFAAASRACLSSSMRRIAYTHGVKLSVDLSAAYAVSRLACCGSDTNEGRVLHDKVFASTYIYKHVRKCGMVDIEQALPARHQAHRHVPLIRSLLRGLALLPLPL